LALKIKSGLDNILSDDTDLTLLVSNIKNYPIEKKAQRQFFENIIQEEEEDWGNFIKKITPAKDRTRYGSALKSSGTSFFKSGSKRSSVIACQNDENDGRASNKSDEATDKQMSASTGHKKVLKIKRSKIQSPNEMEKSSTKLGSRIGDNGPEAEGQDSRLQFYGTKSIGRPPSELEDPPYSGL